MHLLPRDRLLSGPSRQVVTLVEVESCICPKGTEVPVVHAQCVVHGSPTEPPYCRGFCGLCGTRYSAFTGQQVESLLAAHAMVCPKR